MAIVNVLPKYEQPTLTFPYKIKTRLALMALPRRQVDDRGEGMPALSSTGVRKSALRGRASDRINEVAWPYVKRLIMLKNMYKNKFSSDRLARLDRMIEAANSTPYSKLSNSVVILRKPGAGDSISKTGKKRKGWSESDWKKHGEYLSSIAKPNPVRKPKPIERGPHKKIEELLPRIEELAKVPSFKMYKRLSKEDWYRDPTKVAPKAMQYVISDRVKKLAEPKKEATGD